jgi:hypothetical protein
MCEDLDETLCARCGRVDCICEDEDEYNDSDSDLDHHSECGSVGVDIGIDQE